MNVEVISSALLIGFLGAGHCFGMCGGISSALTFAIDKNNWARRTRIIFAYNVGRITSYALIGAAAAAVAGQLQSLGFPYFRVLAAVLMILMGLYISNIWRVLTWLERGGKFVWAYIQPLGSRLMPVKNEARALLLGALWGWLPCGLVYTALAFAATQTIALEGAVVMAVFGLGTLPALLAGGLAADAFRQVFQGRWFRNMSAVAMIVFGLWTLYGSLSHNGHGKHEHHHLSSERPSSQSDMDHSHPPNADRGSGIHDHH